MRLTDRKFRHHVGAYAFQCMLATLTVILVLLTLDATEQTAIIASIGASAFIVFTAPNAYSAKSRALFGGYAVGAVTGIACSLMADLLGTEGTADWDIVIITSGAVAVGLSIFIMVVTDTEHPPAAGLALAFILNSWNFRTLLVVLLAPLLLTLVKQLFRGHIRDLV